ncbi:MAG TPA: tRNA (N(6)-L-threonylcarbamoyladenosine(37)-C(2))-methylthiotransferase MtaB [Syntrophomonadaceae bacterium]|nr:tRNA (N(6)-L-threonylcarbamoyladenosine(37)-C(2))-methylthiotransferase MtaB [Syntrophomonadaceae bacterium]
MVRKIAFYTLGCKVNQVETENMKELFLKRGYELVDYSQPADIYVVNTCTVTHVSDRKSRAMLRRGKKRNADAIVIAAGCLAQVCPEQLEHMEEVNIIIGNSHKEEIVDIVEEELKDQKAHKALYVDDISRDKRPGRNLYSHPHERTRAFIKIQDGCQSFCSYCIVPYARGPVRSKKPEDVLAELDQLLFLGYKEIVLTGIHSGFYGIDLPGWDLPRLLKSILDRFPGDYRIRLSSIEPLELTPPLLHLVANEKRLCRHFHIPLQSGSDEILSRMGRRYKRDAYQAVLQEAAALIPGVALTTDVMVGFPGESEADFAQTCELLENLPFYRLHVFKYSRRQGTAAAVMPDQLDEKEKNKRSDILLALGRKKRLFFEKKLCGSKLSLLVERNLGHDRYIGISDNYVNVLFNTEHDVQGKMIDVLIQDVQDNHVIGVY